MRRISLLLFIFTLLLWGQTETGNSDETSELQPIDVQTIPDAQTQGKFISLESHEAALKVLQDSLAGSIKIQTADKQTIATLTTENTALKASLTAGAGSTTAVSPDTLIITRSDTVRVSDTLRVEHSVPDTACLREYRKLEGDYNLLIGSVNSLRDSLASRKKVRSFQEVKDPTKAEHENLYYQVVRLMNLNYSGKHHLFSSHKNLFDAQVIRSDEEYLDTFFPEFHSDTVLYSLAAMYGKSNPEIAGMLLRKHLVFFPSVSYRSSVEDLYLGKYAKSKGKDSQADSLLALYMGDERQATDVAGEYRDYLRILMGTPIKKAEAYFLDEFRRYEFLVNPADYDEGLFFQYDDWLIKHKYYKLAAVSHKKFARYFPDSPLLILTDYQNAVLLRDKLKNFDQALAAFQKIIDNYKDPGMRKKAFTDRALIYQNELKDMVAAVNEYDHIVEAYPGSRDALDALLSIADIHKTHDKNTELAVQRYRQLITMFPDSLDQQYRARVAIAELYEADKNWENAFQAYMDVVRSADGDDRNAENLLKAGGLKENQLGNPVEAIGIYQEVADLWPKSKEASRAIKAIDAINKKLNKGQENAGQPSSTEQNGNQSSPGDSSAVPADQPTEQTPGDQPNPQR